MGFLNREEIMPKVVDTYGPYQDVRGQLDTVYNDAQNRASQKINQMYANVGMNPRGAPATAAKARSTTDIENQRAQTGYQSYYDWLRGKQLATPQIQPSGASTLASPFISGIGQAVGPSIVSGAASALGKGWNAMTGGPSAYMPNIAESMYTAGAPSYGEGGYGETPYADVAQGFDWSNIPATDAFSAIPTDYIEPTMDMSEALSTVWGW